jgi:hypothetical protein
MERSILRKVILIVMSTNEYFALVVGETFGIRAIKVPASN